MKYFFIILFIIFIYVLYKKCNILENFTPFNVLTKYDDIYVLNKLIKTTVSIFHKNDFKYWMCGGTTIGAIRDKGIIPWDDDADFCIMDTDIENLLKMEKDFKSNNLGLVEWFGGYKIYDLAGKDIEGRNFKFPFIDLFIMVQNDNKILLKNKIALHHWPNEYYFIDELYPLRLYDFEDYQIYGPNSPIEYLNRSYSNWNSKASKTYDHIVHKPLEPIQFDIKYNLNKKPYLWQYWDGPMPSYIKLSMKSVDFKAHSFDIVRLNNYNVYDYLPELIEYKNKLDELMIQQKVDIIRIMLLYKFGGLYLDADVVVLKDPIDLINKLKKYDFVGLGCSDNICIKSIYGKPSNWILASRPNSFLMANVLQNQLNLLKNNIKFEFNAFGKPIIWSELDDLIKNHSYEYYQYPIKLDGSRDKYGNWISSDILFSNQKIEYEDEQNLMFVVYYNSLIRDNVKKMTESELLNTDWNIVRFLRKSFN